MPSGVEVRLALARQLYEQNVARRPLPEEQTPRQRHRRCWFHGLWMPLGDAKLHWHPCCGERDVVDASLDRGVDPPTDDCGWALIGVGRQCGGKGTRHWTQSLDDRLQAHTDREAAGV